MTKFRLGISLLFLLIFLGLLGFIFNRENLPLFSTATDSVSTTQSGTILLQRKDLQTYEELDGILDYASSVQIKPSMNGVLTHIAPEGTELDRGSVIFRSYRSMSESSTLTLSQQIASADASVAQAELGLENLKAPATVAQIASADASVAQAELGLENLKAPATAAQTASADASVGQSEINKTTAGFTVDTAKVALRISRDAFCDRANEIGPREWIYKDEICPSTNVSLTENAFNTIQNNMFLESQMVVVSNDVLIKYKSYQSALNSVKSAMESLNLAKLNRDVLKESPSVAQLEQAEKSLKSAKEQRALLDEKPTNTQLAQASASLVSVKAQRKALDDLPSASELAQKTASLNSAQISLKTALANYAELVTGPSATILLFGDLPAWRDFKEGMNPGLDIEQIERNLVVLGYGSKQSLGIDLVFDSNTAEAIKSIQFDLGLKKTGHIRFGDAIFLPGKAVVEYSASFPDVGTTITAGTVITSLIPTENTQTRIDKDGKISSKTDSLQRVETSITVSNQELVTIGSKVKIELPDESEVQGTVETIGTTAVIPTGNQANDPYLEISVAIDGGISLPQWTGAPVAVGVTKQFAKNVLAVPVMSLVALLEGGYAVEVIDGGSTKLVPVEIGIYSDGWVELKSSVLKPGFEIVVPQ